MVPLPKQYVPKEVEAKWRVRWQEMGIHRWDPTRARNETFVVDSPPPTVSGSLHVGHVLIIVRAPGFDRAPASYDGDEYLLSHGLG
jgi:valyl-tRNA synthetase